MKRFFVDFLISLVALPLAYLLAMRLGSAWFEAFVANRTFTLHEGGMNGGSLLIWSFSFTFFLVVGLVLSKILRTRRPVVWLGCFGLACSLCRFALVTDHILEPSAFVYMRIVGEYIMPILGCMAGAWIGRKFRSATHGDSVTSKPVSASA